MKLLKQNQAKFLQIEKANFAQSWLNFLK
jgi:hypothetical protein